MSALTPAEDTATRAAPRAKALALTPEKIAARVPVSSRRLAVYDGRHRLGTIVEVDGRKGCHAFDGDDLRDGNVARKAEPL